MFGYVCSALDINQVQGDFEACRVQLDVRNLQQKSAEAGLAPHSSGAVGSLLLLKSCQVEWLCFILCHGTGVHVKHTAVGLACVTWASRCFLSVQPWSALTPRLLYMLHQLHTVLVSLMRPVSPILSHLLLILRFSVYSDSPYPSHVACSPGSQISVYIIITQEALELFAESCPLVYFSKRS